MVSELRFRVEGLGFRELRALGEVTGCQQLVSRSRHPCSCNLQDQHRCNLQRKPKLQTRHEHGLKAEVLKGPAVDFWQAKDQARLCVGFGAVKYQSRSLEADFKQTP